MADNSKRTSRKWLLVVFVAALCIRLVYVFSVGGGVNWWPDEAEYNEIAVNLLRWKGYCSSFHGVGHTTSFTAYRVPGLPAFLAMIYMISGPSMLAARVAQALLGAATIPIAFVISRQFGYSRRASLVACAILALYPYYVFCAGAVYPVVLSTTLLGLATIAFMKGRRCSNAVWEAVGGVLVGLTGLTFGHVLLSIPLVALWIVFNKQTAKRSGIIAACVFLATSGATVAPWAVRNAVAMGRLGLSTAFEYNLCLGNAPGSSWNTGSRIYRLESPELKRQAASLNEADRAKLYWSVGVDEIRSNPSRFIMLSAGKALNFWRFYPNFATRSVSTFEKLVGLLTYGPVFALSLIWLVAERKHLKAMSLVLSYPFAAMALASVTVSIDRYRLPFDMYLIIFASAALVTWLDKGKKHESSDVPNTTQVIGASSDAG